MELLEVKLLVGSFLDSHDLCSCVRVSRLWHEIFLPFIYAQAEPTSFHLHWSSFQPQLCHVRDLSIIRTTEPHEKEGFLKDCQRLVRLDFASDLSPEAMDCLIRLLQRNPQLVRVSLWILEGTLYQKLWKTLLDDCPRLTEIEFHRTNLQGVSLMGFMDLAQRLTRLELGDCNLSQLLAWMSSSPPSPFGAAKLQSISCCSNKNSRVLQDNRDWPGFPVLRELIITGYYGDHTWMNQLQIFVRAPKLESLSWNIIDLQYPYVINGTSEEFAPTLVRLLHQRPWPLLNSLEVTEDHLGRLSSLGDDGLAEILTLLPDGLKSFRFPGADFGLLSWQAIQRHLGTLEVLGLTEIPGRMVQGFLTSCRQLRELRGPTLDSMDLVREDCADLAEQQNAMTTTATLTERELPDALIDQPPRMAAATTMDPLARPWVCHRLRVLRITLRRKSGTTESDVQFIQKITELRCLQELFLCPLQKAQHFDGLNPRLALRMELNPPDIRGVFSSTAKIRKHHVGKRLLEIWPDLTSCYWQRF